MRTTERIGLVYRELRIAARRSAARRTRRPFLHLRALKAIQYEGLHTQAELADRLQIDPPAARRIRQRCVNTGVRAIGRRHDHVDDRWPDGGV